LHIIPPHHVAMLRSAQEESGFSKMEPLSEEVDASWMSTKIDVMAFVVGCIAAVAFNVAYCFVFPTEQMRLFFGSGLFMSGVGAEYFGCALVNGSFKNLILECSVMGTVPVLLVVGFAMETPLVAALWLLHPLYDILHHPGYCVEFSKKIGATKVHPRMSWYPMACAGIDIIQGLWILYHFSPEHLSFNLNAGDAGAVVWNIGDLFHSEA